ncbi:uncharacterized protein LOC135939702 [Cloeon dipterum]|uniref:uncharacterized protein LOC135939702 n=1 Tax=Cloeon dipterum TaxID=197152 RepID=UPI00321F8199
MTSATENARHQTSSGVLSQSSPDTGLFGISSKDQNSAALEIKMAKLIALEKGDSTDCTFAVGPNHMLIHASKFDMSVASEAFKAMFRSHLTKPGATIKLDHADPCIFKMMIEFIHTGSFKYGLRNSEEAVKLLLLADEYLVCPLVDLLVDAIETHFLSIQTVWFILDNAVHIKKMADICSKLLAMKTEECLEQPSFLDISKKTLEYFLSFNEMNISSELVLLEACMKIARNNKCREKEYMNAALPHLRLLALKKPEEIWEVSEYLSEDQKNLVARKFFFKDKSVAMPQGLCGIEKPREGSIPLKGSFIVIPDEVLNAHPVSTWIQIQHDYYATFTFETCFPVKITRATIVCEVSTFYGNIQSWLKASVKKSPRKEYQQAATTHATESKTNACIIKSSEIAGKHYIDFNDWAILNEGDTLEIELQVNRANGFTAAPPIMAKATLDTIHSNNNPSMESLFRNFKYERKNNFQGLNVSPLMCMIKSIDYELNN